jgi:hypothetical protein
MSLDKIGDRMATKFLMESSEKPQFEADQLSTLQEVLDDRGVLYTFERVPANELTDIGSENLNKEIVKEKMGRIEKEGDAKPIVVSQDYEIIDGRHETRAIGEVQGKDHKAPVFRIHLPTSEAMGMLGDVQSQLNEDQEDMKIVAVFSGRFQPFHRGHYKVYEHLVNRFGRNDTYIGTSDKVDPPRSPFSFKQKKKIITRLFDVPHENVVEVSNPYGPKEILDQYDPDSTAYVAAVSEKDKGRLLGSEYFNEYPPGERYEGYRDGGYVYTTPMAGFTFRGDEINGTRVREAFRSEDIPEQEKKDFFKYIYGSFDQEVYDLMLKRLTERKKKIAPLIEAFIIDEGIGTAVKNARKAFARQILKEGSTVTKIRGVDDGPTTWYDGLEDYQNEVSEQARLFGFEVLDYITDRVDQDFKTDGLPFDTFYPAGIGPEEATDDPEEIYRPFAEAVAEAAGYELLSYMGTLDEDDIRSLYHDEDENIAMALGDADVGTDPDDAEDDDLEGEETDAADRDEELEGEEESETLEEIVQSVKKNLLKEGGGHGHMNHPFEDLDLTFGDLKNMINLAFDGNLDIEEEPVEKVDGQNLMISWKDGDLCAARNKGHIKNFGADAMDLRDLVQKFEGRGAIREAFEYAFRDLAIALSEVRNKRLQEVFENGRKWMSLEVIYPAAKNVVDYGESFIVFHGVIEHDEAGNAIDFKKDAAYRLAELVEKVNQKVQEEFEIVSPPEVDLPNIQLEDLRSELIGEVEDYMAEYGMSNDNKVMDWHEEWWEEFIREKADQFDYDIPEHVVAGLIKRWAWGNKSGEDGYGLRTFKSQVEDEDFKSWADAFDKNDYKEQFKENIKPIEETFLRLGTEVLKRIETVLAADPEHTEEDIKQQLQDVRQELDGAPADESSVQTLQQQMDRLEKAGGIDDIALEGIVFQYDGKTYKLTGSWAPLNQIVGIMKYGR